MKIQQHACAVKIDNILNIAGGASSAGHWMNKESLIESLDRLKRFE